MFVIVPDCVSESINSALTELYSTLPESEREIAEKDREVHYRQAIDYFSETGIVPTFGGLVKNETNKADGE